MPIRVNRPFHCKLMEPAAAVYKEDIQSVPFADPIIPVYMNVTGEMETKADQIKENIVQQLYSPSYGCTPWRICISPAWSDMWNAGCEACCAEWLEIRWELRESRRCF